MSKVKDEFFGCEQRVYGWLADVFWNIPSRKTIDSFCSIEFSCASLDLRAVARSLAECIAHVDNDAYEEIEIDYTSLFAACRVGNPYPFESVFLGDEPGIMMQAPRDTVMRLYQKYDYETEKGWPWQPEDHLSHELRFVAVMHERLASARDDDELSHAGEALDAMKYEHLQKWVPTFSGAVCQKAKTEFYRLSASLLDEMVKS